MMAKHAYPMIEGTELAFALSSSKRIECKATWAGHECKLAY